MDFLFSNRDNSTFKQSVKKVPNSTQARSKGLLGRLCVKFVKRCRFTDGGIGSSEFDAKNSLDLIDCYIEHSFGGKAAELGKPMKMVFAASALVVLNFCISKLRVCAISKQFESVIK